jgi:hypothetical protein
MRTVDDLLEQAKRLPPQARKELRDRLDESLGAEEPPAAETVAAGPYASLLKMAGSAHSLFPDVARHKNSHLADVYAAKRGDR